MAVLLLQSFSHPEISLQAKPSNIAILAESGNLTKEAKVADWQRFR